MHHRLVRFFDRGLMPGRQGQDACGAEMNGRRAGCGEPNAAVAMPAAFEVDGWKEEGQRGGGHHVVERQAGLVAAPLRPFPRR